MIWLTQISAVPQQADGKMATFIICHCKLFNNDLCGIHSKGDNLSHMNDMLESA